jgi:hypothetical protein
MNTPVEIVPAQITQVKNVSSFRVTVTSLELFKSVTLNVQFFDEKNAIVDIKTLQISGTDYTNWNNDDNYIINYIATKYGFTKKP